MVSAAPAPENRTPPSAVDWIAQSSVPGTKPRQISLRLRNRQWGCDGSSTGIPQNPEAAQAAKEDGEQGDQEAGVLTERGVGQDQAIRAAFQQNAAQAAIDAGPQDGSGDPFYATKLKIGRVFLERILPEADAHLAKMKGGAEALMALEDELF